MNNWLHVHSFCRGSRDLAFPGKILQEVREEKLQLKDLDFSQTKYHLTKGFPHFFISYFILSENNNSVKTISISADNDLSPLGRCIFKRRNLSI